MPNKNFDNASKAKSINCNANILKEKQCAVKKVADCNNVNLKKKTYLKKGAGLAKYGLTLEEINKKRGKLKFRKPLLTVPSKIKVPRNCLNQVTTFPKVEFGK